jgi:hypothetical protein
MLNCREHIVLQCFCFSNFIILILYFLKTMKVIVSPKLEGLALVNGTGVLTLSNYFYFILDCRSQSILVRL